MREEIKAEKTETERIHHSNDKDKSVASTPKIEREAKFNNSETHSLQQDIDKPLPKEESAETPTPRGSEVPEPLEPVHYD